MSAVLALALPSFAATNVTAGPRYVFRTFGQADGLGNIAIHALSIDPAGFVWVATENGLFRFIGSGFERFGFDEGIREAYILDVLAAPDGTVWVTTEGNLYRRSGDRFRPALSRTLPADAGGKLAWEGPGRLLVAEDSGLFRLVYGSRGETVSYLPVVSPASRLSFRGLAVSRDGTVWSGCGEGICSVRGGVLERWGPERGVPADERLSLISDRAGNIWAESRYYLEELPLGGAVFEDRTPPHKDKGSYFSRLPLAVDPQGRILVSADEGIARWDGSGWQVIGPANGLVSTHITALAFDAEGNLWMGSTGHGVYYAAGYGQIDGWTERQGLPSSNIWSVGLFDGNRGWFGTAKGPVAIEFTGGANGSEAKVIRLFSEEKWAWGQVAAMTRDTRGTVWAGTTSGALLRIAGGSSRGLGHATLVASLGRYIYTLTVLPEGGILIGTGGEILYLDAAAGAVPTPVPEAAALLRGWARIQSACTAPDQSVWFATSRGLLRRQVVSAGGTRWEVPAVARFAPDTPVEDIACAADGGVWISGQRSGIRHIEVRGKSFRAVPLLLPRSFRNLSVVAIAADRKGRLWLGTDNGVLAWNVSSWRHITQESGLVWNDVNQHRIAVAPDGSIVVGTSGGLARITSPDSIFAAVPLPLSLLRVSRGGERLDSARIAALPWSQRELSFRFAVPDALSRSSVQFRYRVPQLDPSWTETDVMSARFAAMPPGDYTLEAQALSADRSVESPVISVQFGVLAPWWRAGWFMPLSALTATLFAIVVYRLRTSHLVRQRRILEDTVRERTAELEASRRELLIQATHDPLTGLLNRAGILDFLGKESVRVWRERRSLTVILADLDHFKRINDTYGHSAGDDALRSFAKATETALRSYDGAGRYGGEEFLFVLPGDGAETAAERVGILHRSVSNLTFFHSPHLLGFTCSMGAVSTEPANEPPVSSALLAEADRALYEAKRAGRNRVTYRVFQPNGGPKAAAEVGISPAI